VHRGFGDEQSATDPGRLELAAINFPAQRID
jgi:hypothetical protein